MADLSAPIPLDFNLGTSNYDLSQGVDTSVLSPTYGKIPFGVWQVGLMALIGGAALALFALPKNN